MKRKMLFFSGIISVVLLSGCLKDTPFLTVDNTAPLVEFGLSPVNGQTGPFSYEGDTAGAANIDTAVALLISSPQVLTKSVNITIAVDTSQISAWNAQDTVTWSLLPSNLYKLANTVITIPAGYRVGRIPVTLNLGSFPAAHNYALPLKVVDGGGLQINTTNGSNDFMWFFSR